MQQRPEACRRRTEERHDSRQQKHVAGVCDGNAQRVMRHGEHRPAAVFVVRRLVETIVAVGIDAVHGHLPAEGVARVNDDNPADVVHRRMCPGIVFHLKILQPDPKRERGLLPFRIGEYLHRFAPGTQVDIPLTAPDVSGQRAQQDDDQRRMPQPHGPPAAGQPPHQPT